jgi:DNA-directed RNA polymerase specialized sigma24 family protein
MRTFEANERTDELLRPYLLADGPAESEGWLAQLISDHAQPVIIKIIKDKLGVSFSQRDGSRENQDALEVAGEVQAMLLAELKGLKENQPHKAINNFRSYVAVVTYHACYEYLRRKYPQRHSLKNKLRYLLTHHPGLALWESSTHELLCGLPAWRGRESDAAATSASRCLQPLIQSREDFARSSFGGKSLEQVALAELVTALFKEIKGPLELDALTNAVAELQGIKDQVEAQSQREGEGGEETEELIATLPDPRETVAVGLDRKLYLERLWSEICQLPPNQRAALLLNLKDAQGRSMVEMLPLVGIASIRQIAAALEIPALEFAELWNRLPLEDMQLADRLGLTRQQIINLRKSARDRLARKMRDY